MTTPAIRSRLSKGGFGPEMGSVRTGTALKQVRLKLSTTQSYLEPIEKNKMPRYDFNHLERTATKFIDDGNFVDATKLYLFMSDGDPSLDAGYLGERLGICYEQVGDLHAAKYWYGRAVEENPEVRLEAARAYERLSSAGIDHLL